MNTPICDFLDNYQSGHMTRFHMPGHKGKAFLGCEGLDITEVSGADSLYEADGIIAQSERNATDLFGSARTVYSTEGSSQCIRAMLYLALTHRPAGAAPVIVAARNVHKAFVYAAALLDLEVVWLYPDTLSRSLCSCPISAETLEQTLSTLPAPPAAVYITSPDYLGGIADIAALSEVCHRHGTILAVDNAHGAYLRFLTPSRHPLDLGADICCDSAHKTLPVLTGGAYLHLSRRTPQVMRDDVKAAMALFGSTSPSYLILASLDRCNRYLAEEYPAALAEMVDFTDQLRHQLAQNGWQLLPSDPLRITLSATAAHTGIELAAMLRKNGIECEYADPDTLVLMLTPENQKDDLLRFAAVLSKNTDGVRHRLPLPSAKAVQRVSVRNALFAPHELIETKDALHRICAAPTVACPPAIPIAVSGEEITQEAITLFAHYGIDTVDVLK